MLLGVSHWAPSFWAYGHSLDDPWDPIFVRILQSACKLLLVDMEFFVGILRTEKKQEHLTRGCSNLIVSENLGC